MNTLSKQPKSEQVVQYISVFFQSLIKSKAGKELTESHEREAMRRREAMPSHHHYMIQPILDRAEYFRNQYKLEKARLMDILNKEGFRFKQDYDFEQAGALDFTCLELLIERV